MFQLGLLGQILKIYLSKKEGTYTMAIINIIGRPLVMNIIQLCMPAKVPYCVISPGYRHTI